MTRQTSSTLLGILMGVGMIGVWPLWLAGIIQFTVAAGLAFVFAILVLAITPGPDAATTYGGAYPQVICPHCRAVGAVRVKNERVKQGISGAKAAGAVVTGGWSILATGLSRKETVQVAHCGHCGMTWRV